MSKKRLVIRADADKSMGSGHVMRCIALGQAWQKLGHCTWFACATDSAALAGRIKSEGFRFIPMQGLGKEPRDLERMYAVLEESRSPWLVLDGYQFDAHYHRSIYDSNIRLMVIDDHNHLPYYHTDVLLNQTPESDKMPYRCPSGTLKFTGSQFCLLRDEFTQRRKIKRTFPSKAENILVTMGGADPDNTAEKVLQALKRLKMKNAAVKVIVGYSNPHYSALVNASTDTLLKIELVRTTDHMPELMEWADMAVSAGGSTAWELCFMGVPAIYISIADNQGPIVRVLKKSDAGMDAGRHNELDLQKLTDMIDVLVQNPYKRKTLSVNGMNLIPGFGADNICRHLESNYWTPRS